MSRDKRAWIEPDSVPLNSVFRGSLLSTKTTCYCRYTPDTWVARCYTPGPRVAGHYTPGARDARHGARVATHYTPGPRVAGRLAVPCPVRDELLLHGEASAAARAAVRLLPRVETPVHHEVRMRREALPAELAAMLFAARGPTRTLSTSACVLWTHVTQHPQYPIALQHGWSSPRTPHGNGRVPPRCAGTINERAQCQ